MDYKLFQPSNIDMFREYPELKDYKEFVDIKSNDELLFTWYYGNPTSEYYKLEEKEKRKACYEKVWGVTNDTKYVQYAQGNFPENVRSGIERMKSFKPSARMRAKMMTEKTFSDFEKIMNKSMEDIVDVDEVKKYTELKMKIAEQLPDLIKQMESGFGIKEIGVKDSDKRVATYADTIHDAISRNKN